MRALGLVALLCVVGACRSQDSNGASEPIDVHLAGCARTLSDRGCAVESSTRLHLWVPELITSPRLELNGTSLGFESDPIDDGVHLSVVLPSVGRLRLQALRGSKPVSWSIELAEVTPESSALQAIFESPLDGTEKVAAAINQLVELKPAEQGRAWSRIGRAQMNLGLNEDALDSLERSSTLHEQQGCLSCALNDQLAGSYVATYQTRDFARAERLLSSTERPFAEFPKGYEQRLYYRALFEIERGNLREAVRQLELSIETARKLGSSLHVFDASMVLARELQVLGFDQKAKRLFRSLVGEFDHRGQSACDLGHVYINAAWGELSVDSDRISDESAEWTRKAIAAARECGDRSMRANALLNAALGAVGQRKWREAREFLSQSEALEDDDLTLLPWRLETEGRIALGTGNFAEAQGRYQALKDYAGRHSDLASAWRAQAGLGRSLRGLGDVSRAASEFLHGERLLDERAAGVGLGDGRIAFVDNRTRATAELADLLLESGRAKDAFRVLRHARKRGIEWLARV
ncbi:MAG: hypothetical protein AAFY60_02930, partial [Myxococcota bacterium]